MGNKKILEEIFLKDGKFIDKNGIEVNPKMVGLPKVIYSDIKRNFIEDLYESLNFECEEANAFLKGKERTYTGGRLFFNPHSDCAIQLYKI